MINHNDIKAQLIRGAVRSEYMVYPNPVAGYGKLNIYLRLKSLVLYAKLFIHD